jgi:hypothetical protein
VAVLLGPFDSLVLRLEGGKHVVRMILSHIVLDWASLRMALGARLYVDIRHLPSTAGHRISGMFCVLPRTKRRRRQFTVNLLLVMIHDDREWVLPIFPKL